MVPAKVVLRMNKTKIYDIFHKNTDIKLLARLLRSHTLTMWLYRTMSQTIIDFNYLTIMAKNSPSGDNARRGMVTGRSQVQNPKTGLWTKRDTENGRFMDVKTSSSEPFKGIRKEK